MFRQRRRAVSARIFYSECNLAENKEKLQLLSMRGKLLNFSFLWGRSPPQKTKIQRFLPFA